MFPRFGPALTLVAAFLAAACLKVPQQSPSLAAVDNAAVTSTQLQLRTYEAGRRFSFRIEAAADSIAGLTRDPLVRQRALLWKTSAIPLVQEASLQNDPVVAAVDLWAFTIQQVGYFERGDGRDAFGLLQPVALAAAGELEQDARRTLGESLTTGEVKAGAIEAVSAWASKHPMRGAELRRESVLSSNWKALGITTSSLAGTVANLDRTLVGVTNRLGYINEAFLKQVRWHAELMANEALSAPRVDSTLSTLSATTAVVGDMLSGAPSLIDRERTAFFRTLATHEAAIFAAVDEQRVATLKAVTEERTAVLAAVREERLATLASVDSIAQRSIEHVQAVAIRLLRWTFIALAVLATFLGVGALWLARSWRAAGARGS
jgi:hypothetical protein